MLTKAVVRYAIDNLLEIRHENVLLLFRTLPFYAWNDDERDIATFKKLQES